LITSNRSILPDVAEEVLARAMPILVSMARPLARRQRVQGPSNGAKDEIQTLHSPANQPVWITAFMGKLTT